MAFTTTTTATTTNTRRLMLTVMFLLEVAEKTAFSFSTVVGTNPPSRHISSSFFLSAWVQVDSGGNDGDGEWVWEEDDPNFMPPPSSVATAVTPTIDSTGQLAQASATPQLASGEYKPKQSLGQNYLKDGNTVAKILRAFHEDAIRGLEPPEVEALLSSSSSNNNNNNGESRRIVELGPGAGALTDKLVETYGAKAMQCIELDERSIQLLGDKHGENLLLHHQDVLQVNYPALALEAAGMEDANGADGPLRPPPLAVIGNLPYYITSQILFCLADASHSGAVRSATVTMQWEVAQRMVARTCTKDYGILSVVFQLYTERCESHFKIPPTVFYPQPKVDSALVGFHFLGPEGLEERLQGVAPEHLRTVVTTAFRQRRKTIRNSLKKLARQLCNGNAAQAAALFSPESSPPPLPAAIQHKQERILTEQKERGWQGQGANPNLRDTDSYYASELRLSPGWASMRPEELSAGQFVELTRLLYGYNNKENGTVPTMPLKTKVWRKSKHGD